MKWVGLASFASSGRYFIDANALSSSEKIKLKYNINHGVKLHLVLNEYLPANNTKIYDLDINGIGGSLVP